MPTKQTNQEIEVRFLNIDKTKLISKLRELGAKDHEEELMNYPFVYLV